ncbi:MAG: radical SAM protein [Bacteroidetes bacterium]|nr:MAG: radical SAM protein [Bacteroidota bacterium]
MRIVAKTKQSEIASVYIAELKPDTLIEFTESVYPNIPRIKKWIITVSTLDGCPVACKFCDAGFYYKGKLSKDDILSQILYLVDTFYSNRNVPVEKFKIQFARMGEPTLNYNVINVLKDLPTLINAPGLMPSLSTVAPKGCERFLDELIEIKNNYYKSSFQLQFSIHSTNQEQRNNIIPIQKWDFDKIVSYSENFFQKGARKISLNFALDKYSELNVDVLSQYFSPDIFLIKFTPINPTFSAEINKLSSLFTLDNSNKELIKKIEDAGYEVILSFGEQMENRIGSNCGQHILNFLKSGENLKDSYTFDLIRYET